MSERAAGSSGVNLGVTAGVLAGCAVGWNTTNVGAIAATAADSYEISLASVGLFTTALFLTHLAMQIPGGRLVDAVGARRICAAGIAIVGCGTAIAMIAPIPALGIGARAVTGVGTGLGFIAGSSYVRRAGGTAFAQGLFGGIGLGTGGVALAFVPALVPLLSWRASYVPELVLVAVALGALALAPTDHGGEAPPRPSSSASVLSDRRLWRLALLYSATFGLALVLSNWVVELLERHVTDEAGAGLIGATILLVGVFSRTLGGWIVRSHGPYTRRAVALGLVAGGAGSGLLAVAGSIPIAIVACALIGFGGGISFAPTFTGGAALRPDAPAAAVGFVNATAAAAVLVFTPLLGLSFSLPGGGRLGFAIAVLLWLTALVRLPDRESLGA
jgi:MFS family permease